MSLQSLIDRLRPRPGTEGVYLTDAEAAELLAALSGSVTARDRRETIRRDAESFDCIGKSE